MNTKLETIIQNVAEQITLLKEYTETHASSYVEFDLIDELDESVSMLNDVVFELESRASMQDDE